jgi:hypothetical protein
VTSDGRTHVVAEWAGDAGAHEVVGELRGTVAELVFFGRVPAGVAVSGGRGGGALADTPTPATAVATVGVAAARVFSGLRMTTPLVIQF